MYFLFLSNKMSGVGKTKHYHQPASAAVDATAATDDAVVQRRLVDDL